MLETPIRKLPSVFLWALFGLGADLFKRWALPCFFDKKADLSKSLVFTSTNFCQKK
ncbi:hypothetical protein D932_03021 [Enterococcus casseliflavus 14-MB-W-14]|nr:hypothetical protein D932_03021 [Enterococcus casseliflavus 14-MB-W-14]